MSPPQEFDPISVSESSDLTVTEHREIVRQFLERVDGNSGQKSQPDDEIEEGRAAHSETMLSDEAFKVERILILLGFYRDCGMGDAPKTFISYRDFLEQIKQGNNGFDGIVMKNAVFENFTLQDTSLEKAWLINVLFKRVGLYRIKLNGAFLSHCEFNDLTVSSLAAIKADFDNTIFSQVKLDGSVFNQSSFKKAIFRQTSLIDANLSKVNLAGAILEDCNLLRANFIGAELSHANLSGSNLSHAILSSANLSNANLRGANLLGASLENANLTDADLSQAVYDSNTCFDRNFDIAIKGAYLLEPESYLVKANLENIDLSGRDLSGCNFSQSRLTNVNLRNADLRYANFSEAILKNMSLAGARLHCAILEKAQFIKVELVNTNFSAAAMTSVKLSNADCRSADFRGAILQNADLRCARLGSANLSGADLQGADLRAADLSNTDLMGANLGGVDLTSVKLKGATMPDGKIVE